MGSRDEEVVAALMRIALAGDGIVIGVGLTIVAIRTWHRFYHHSKALHKLHNTPLTRISDLTSLLTQQEQSLVMVRGTVASREGKQSEDKLLTAQSTGEKAVVVDTSQTYIYNVRKGLFGWSSDWRGLLGWASLKEQMSVSRRKVPFVLIEDGNHGYAFAHIDVDETTHPLPLVTVHHVFRPIQASPYTLLQAIFGRGYPVGLLDEEKILPLEKEITAVGLLHVCSNGHPVIKSSKHLPYFLTDHTRDQLLDELSGNAKLLLWTGVVLSSVAIGVLGYAVIQNWHRWLRWWQRRRRQEEQAANDRLSAEAVNDDIENMPDGELCVVCLMRRRHSAFIPCGHRVCCMRCAQRIEQDNSSRCPVCRQNVHGSIRIYDT